MHDYDVALKLILQDVDLVMRALTGGIIEKWFNIELPTVNNLRADLIGETQDGRLIQMEFQSDNDSEMALRMAEYYLRVFRQFDRYPEQVVLYVGERPMKMSDRLVSQAMQFQYRLIDVRELDGESFLESAQIGDNMFAMLARQPDLRKAVRKVLQRIESLSPEKRESTLSRFLILAGLRKTLGAIVEEEAQRMPITEDIRNHPLFSREYQRGREEGVQEGRQEGRQEGELALLRRLLEKRFGVLPPWAEARFRELSVEEVDLIGLQLLDAVSLSDLLG